MRGAGSARQSRVDAVSEDAASGVYSPTALEHFRNPRNVGVIEDADGVGCAENPASGASIVLYLQVSDDRVRSATFQAQGCAATIASASVATEMIQGQGIDSVARISRRQIERSLGGLPPTRKHSAALVEEAVRAAVEDYGERRGG